MDQGRIERPASSASYAVAEDRQGNTHSTGALRLVLDVTDPEVLQELLCRSEGQERTDYALAALRVGVLSLRTASGQLDAATIREAGTSLLGDIRELLTQRGEALTGKVQESLTSYLDPRTGSFQQRLDSLVKGGGELESLLRVHLGPEDSVLAKSLAQHLGEGSPIFRMLSPTDAHGLRAQVQALLEKALTEQRTEVLRQFSLDQKDSAISRLVETIRQQQGDLSSDLKAQVNQVVEEFSLNNENGALTRLVQSVEVAQRRITDEFTTDNEASALSRLSRLLAQTTDSIHQNLTLDDDSSALSRLKRELQAPIEDLAKRNAEFQQSVAATLAELKTRKEMAAATTRHGIAFEDCMAEWLELEAQRLGDVFERTGNTPGAKARSKKGDVVIRLGAESAAPHAVIVFEAKDVKAFTQKDAIDEMEEAIKNRSAQLGVFVCAARSAPEKMERLSRQGNVILAIWDDEDPSTDVVLKAAYSSARALAVRQIQAEAGVSESLATIERATREVEKQVGRVEKVKTSANTSHNATQRILQEVELMQTDLEKQVQHLDQAVTALKQDRAQG